MEAYSHRSDVSKLKEMTLLPLLYPDMFQSLGVTPPRGVLFHGPPGTGKTLVARALAASCRSEGRSVCKSPVITNPDLPSHLLPSVLYAQRSGLPLQMGG